MHHALLQLADAQPLCQPMMGLHPCSVAANYTEELAIVAHYFATRPFVAVGEIGLDFYWDTTFKNEQYTAFEAQLALATSRALPVAIHSRNAIDECIAVVQQHPGARGVFHCFTGTVAQAEKIISLGFYLGIGGVATFKKSGLDQVIAAVGLDNIMLETDAPYLAPVPYRGKRNESAYLPLVAEKLAAVSGKMVADVAEITTRNARALFQLR